MLVPANTPVWLPRRAAGSMPASSSASQRDFQQQPLLRVHRQRLARADPEEARVEVGRVVDEPALARVARPRDVGIRVIQALEVPAAVGRGIREIASPPCATSSHSSSGVRDTARVAAAHADDRDRVLGSRPASHRCADARGSRCRAGSAWTSVRRCVATARQLGWSKTSVAGSRSPVARISRLRSSTALSESNPRSLKARSRVDRLGRAVPEHAPRPGRARAPAPPRPARFPACPPGAAPATRRRRARSRRAGRPHEAAQQRRQDPQPLLGAQRSSGPGGSATQQRVAGVARRVEQLQTLLRGERARPRGARSALGRPRRDRRSWRSPAPTDPTPATGPAGPAPGAARASASRNAFAAA